MSEEKKLNISLNAKERAELYECWKELKTVQAVAAAKKLSLSTVGKYKKLDEWEKKRDAEFQDAKEFLEHCDKLKNVPTESIREETIRKMEIILNLRVTKLQDALLNGEDGEGVANELQKMAATLEKNQVVEIKKASGGVERTAHMELKCDIVELTKLQMEAKRWGIDISGKDLLADYDNIRKQIEQRKQQNS